MLASSLSIFLSSGAIADCRALKVGLGHKLCHYEVPGGFRVSFRLLLRNASVAQPACISEILLCP
jgi:hypothetical protein